MDYYLKKSDDVLMEVKSSVEGLSSKDASSRLKKYGKNKITKVRKFHGVKVFLSQFKSFLIYLLIIAAVISFVISNFIDGVVILCIVALNAGIGFFQTYKAEKAIEKLKKLLVLKSKVIRDCNMIEVLSEDLVSGDIVVMAAGDKVSADMRIIDSENLQTNEAILTGESLPVDKISEMISKTSSLGDRKNMLYTGTEVVRGSCKAVVVKIGMDTVFGNIASDLGEIDVVSTPIQKKMDLFSKQVGLVILGIVLFIFLLGIFEKFDSVEMFMVGVALAVSAIPEGLPAVLVIGFAISSYAMSKSNVIVRRLPAVESLGSVTVICSDKTGTITKEEMSVREYYSNNSFYKKKKGDIFVDASFASTPTNVNTPPENLESGSKIDFMKDKNFSMLVKTSILCNDAKYNSLDGDYGILGDPTEGALLAASLDLGYDKKILTEKEPRFKKFDFDSKRKMMSVIRKGKVFKMMYSKGASEIILKASNYELVNGEVRELTDKRRAELLKISEEMARKALRVLAFAYKEIKKNDFDEDDLVFVGFGGMIDSPRDEVKAAIKECYDAQIKVKMITGDSKETAVAIAREVGIVGNVLTHDELEKMNDRELSRVINTVSIFARVSPSQKLRITEMLQKKGEVVAITGDGVNDSLALKAADVGIAMGIRGTDVSRDVSDIVLSDDNFASIVSGVKEGRKTYDNIKKFVKYLLAVNFSEVFLVMIALVFTMPLPLLPLQILWINLVTDSFPALALVFEREENVMKTAPRREKSILSGIWKFIIFAGILAFLADLAVYFIGINQGWEIELIRTMVLTTSILFELLFVYVCRSEISLFKRGVFSNKYLNYAVLFSLVLHLALIYSFVGKYFGLVRMSLNNWLLIVPFAVSGLVLFEGWKLVKVKKY